MVTETNPSPQVTRETLPASNPSAQQPQPERKQVTVLFCDVVDYTSRSVSLDPEDLADEIRVFQTICGAISEQHHGHISSYLGDGILVLFGHPVADEFAPERAVRAGMAMVEQIKRNNADPQWRGREPIGIRVGIATGLVVVGERAGSGRDQDELIFGEAPNLAARLQALAEPNTVLTALRTRRLVGRAFKFRDRGEHRVKGFNQPVNAWQILHASTFQNRSTTSLKRVTTRFVSRKAELKCLKENYEQALNGSGRIAHISGDPGIGKSRLIRAFEKTIRKQNLYRLRVTCSPYFRNSSFKPIIDETHRWLQISEQDNAKVKRENIHAAMVAIELDGGDEHALFNELLAIPMPPGQSYLDISAEEKHHRSVDALTSFVTRLSRLHPLLLVVEDLHWADPSTLEVLTSIIARVADENLFAIFTSRTGFVASWQGADAPPAELTHIPLGGFNDGESQRLIAAVPGSQELPDPVKRALIQKSGGVPLFLEETSWHLVNQIRLDQFREADNIGGLYNLFTIPDTLQDSLNARLDQLGAAKSFAQLAATFGSDFHYSLIGKIAAQNGIDADSGMDILLEADILTLTPGKAEDRYAFRHVLFQEAAYHSLLKKHRQRYHGQIAEALQENAAMEQQHPELIAYHYTHAERVSTAVDLWLQAGQQAIAKSAIDEALQHLSEGLKLVAKLPAEGTSRELALQLCRGVALTARAGYHGSEVMAVYQHALTLAEDIGNDQQTWTALYGLWRCRVSRAEFSESVRVAVKLKWLSEKSGDPKLLMTAHGLQGMTRMVAGKFIAAERFYDKAVKLYDQSRDKNMGVRFGQDPYVTLRGLGAVNKLILNKIPESLTEITKSEEVARAIGHPYTVAETLRVAAMYHQIAGDLNALRSHAEETVSLGNDHGFEGLLAAGNIFLAFCDVLQHGQSSKIRSIRRNLTIYADNYGMLFLPYFHGVLAQACLSLQNYTAAMRAAQKAMAVVERFGEEWSRAPLLGLQAEAAAKGGGASAVEIAGWYQTGIQTATAQNADFIVAKLQASQNRCRAIKG